MISAMKRRFDSYAGKLMEVLLKLIYIRTDPWATQSNPVPLTEVRDALEKEKCNPYLIQYLEQYIKVIGIFHLYSLSQYIIVKYL